MAAMRTQLERQFTQELDHLPAKTRRAALSAADALTQIETIDLSRHDRRFSSGETAELLRNVLRLLLDPAG